MFFGFFRSLTVAGTGLLVAFTSGCASTLSSDSSSDSFSKAAAHSSADSKRVQALQLRLRKQAALLQDLKERNFVLEKREHLRKAAEIAIDEEGVSIASTAPLLKPEALSARLRSPAAGVAPALPVMKALVVNAARKDVTPISISPEKTGEHYLYSKILETYGARNAVELEKTLELLLKTYPESVFADNAIYMSGLLAFESDDYRTALKQFDKLLQEYPRSNKAVAALFAKASIEKRTGRVSEAKRGFLQLRDLYPGSPEAARVSVELKLLESASLKHRES